jgi:hypothetical protein
MLDELYDEKAFVCTDCLMLIANGDMPNYEYQYPEKTEAECEEMTRDYRDRIERTMHGFNITLGWGREQHDCASNYTVTALLRSETDGDDYREGDEKEYRAEFASEALEKAEFDFTGSDVIGFRAVSHDLETEGDRGGECECETDNFATRTCDHCGDHFAGTWHAATIWKITEE